MHGQPHIRSIFVFDQLRIRSLCE